MKCNIGKTDRIIRAIIGGSLIGYGLAQNNILADAIGVVILTTAVIAWCPPYAMFGIDTGCKREEETK